jgi:Fic family protein
MESIHATHHHISFTKRWELNPEILYLLGQCDALMRAISETPIQPEHRQMLLTVSLIRGAQATTAIEGNTLTEEEIIKIQEGKNLPPSRAYLQKEVENIIKALNFILDELINNEKINMITSDLIRRFHRMVGEGLGEAFDAHPGEFRRTNVIVGGYRPPSFSEVPGLAEKLCAWLDKEFHFKAGQTPKDTIIQAIVTHIYIAWIHPFSDGNGRTARLLEFYLLMRAGVPDIASHLLSNFYNKTRSEYYRQIDKATKSNDLSAFLRYAVEGLKDGLFEVLEVIQESQLLITWKSYIYNVFEQQLAKGKTSLATKRKRNLMLIIPQDRSITLDEVFNLDPSFSKNYGTATNRTFFRDIESLMKLNLLTREGTKYRANIKILRRSMARTTRRKKA